MFGMSDDLMVSEAAGMLGHEVALVVDAHRGGIQLGPQMPSSQIRGTE